jgi:predicted transposase/invertase (TIGR01784 family)
MFESKNYLTKHLIVNQENGKQELKDFEFIFIELPKFKIEKNQINELNTVIEKWIWFLKHTQELDLIPKKLKNIKEFEDAFLIATQYQWSKKDIEIYEYMTLKEYDEINAIETSYGNGKIEGKIEGKKETSIEIAKNSLKQGLDIKTISLITNLSIEEIEKLKNNLSI